MRLKSALRRGVAAAVIAGIVVSSGIPAYAAPWNIADGDITVKAGDTEGTNWVSQGEKEDVKDTDTVITGESDKNTVTIDTSKGDVDVTFDDLKIDVSGKTEVDGSGDGSTRESNAAVTVQGGGDATIELDGDNKLKSGSNNAGLEKNKQESKGTLTIKDDKGKDGSLTAEGGDGVGAQQPEIDQDTPPSNPNNIIICGDAEVTAKAGRSQMLDAKAPAIGGSYGEVPTENLSDDEHKVTGGRLTRLRRMPTSWKICTTTTMMMTSRPRCRRTLPNPCPAAWWWAASFPAGSPSSGWTLLWPLRAPTPCPAA